MFKDQWGFIVDETGDGGDTANREGQWAYITDEDRSEYLTELTDFHSYYWVRHPKQNATTANRFNFTRDQAIPMVAALGKAPPDDKLRYDGKVTIRSFFWACIFRGGFMPNFQRDRPGSWKWPWPHAFWKDSYPTVKTWLWPNPPPLNSMVSTVIEKKNFDFADPMGSPFFGLCVIAGQMRLWYWALPWCYLMMLVAVKTWDEKNDDVWQLAIMCDVYDQKLGTNLLERLNERVELRRQAGSYFTYARKMREFADAWSVFLKKRGIA